MNWLNLFAWAGVLLVQNASFTLVSRARNSGSIGFHALASIGSNGVWFLSQFIVVATIADVLKTKDWSQGIGYGLWYTLWTVLGSISMHYISMRWLEKGKRKVGG